MMDVPSAGRAAILAADRRDEAMAGETISVLIVDDHAVVRRGIRAFLDTEPAIEVVGEAVNGTEAVTEAERLDPDVILMDLVMPEMDGAEAIRRIRKRKPGARILVLTSFGSDDKLFPAVTAGALGYLLKETPPEDLIRAIREAAAGQAALDPIVARRLLREFSREHALLPPAEPLTDREIEVLKTLTQGLSNEQIAKRLFISEATVRTHVSNILAKLGLDNRTQAALYALKEGLVSLGDIGDLPS
jgi:NarL family two-component system response regulator LiaR